MMRAKIQTQDRKDAIHKMMVLPVAEGMHQPKPENATHAKRQQGPQRPCCEQPLRSA
jgi:hypothetical protein